MLVFIPVTGNSSDVPQIRTYEDCVPVVGYIVDRKDEVSKDDLIQFFSAFSNEQCLNNAEFSEYGNEVLFSLIESNPLLFFQTLFSLNQTQIEAIKFQIDNPIHDGINVIKKYETVKNANMPEEVKTKALDLLKKSYVQEKEMIKDWEKNNNQKWEYPASD